MGIESTDPDHPAMQATEGLALFIVGTPVLLGLIAIGQGLYDRTSSPENNRNEKNKVILEYKASYETKLKEDEGSAYLRQEDGGYKPFTLSEQQRSSIKSKLK